MNGRTLFAQTDTPSPDETFEELANLTVGDWLLAGGIMLGAVLFGMLVRWLVVRSLEDRSGQLVARLLGRFALALVVAIGLVYALNQVGVSMGPLLGLLGLLGLALALAFQEVLSNFIAGVMLSLRRPFRVGDEINTSDFEGKVDDVSLRSVTMTTFDGVRVIIPNSSVWENPISNYTALESRRTDLSLGVGYDSDLDRVQEMILETVASIDGVSKERKPDAFVHEFGDSSINFAVRFWHEPQRAEQWQVRDRVARALKKRLDEAGVEIPFPQLVLHRPEDA